MYWPTINGVSTFSRNLAIGMSALGHEVLVIAPSQTGDHYEEMDGNYRILRLASTNFPFYHSQTASLPNQRKIAGLSVPRVYVDNGFRISLTPQREIKRALDEFRPDIIHNQQYLMIGQAILSYARKRDIPIVHTNHVLPENLLDNLKLLAPFSRPIAHTMKSYGVNFVRKFDYATMPTQVAVDITVSKHIANGRFNIPVEVVSNGIDLVRFRPGRPDEAFYKKYKLPVDVPIVTYLGRLDMEKHISILVEAFAHIQKSTGSHLLLVGDGTDTHNLKNLVKKYRISNHVTFTGRVIGDDLMGLHQVGTVFCVPSPVELQCIAALEAMASGLPLVAVRAGAIQELCADGVNGYLCEKDSIKQIEGGLERILLDPKLRTRFSEASIKIASKHDIKQTLKRFETIYREVIKSYA